MMERTKYKELIKLIQRYSKDIQYLWWLDSYVQGVIRELIKSLKNDCTALGPLPFFKYMTNLSDTYAF